MPLVSSSIANLVNGVSQQPYTLRLSSQAEVQENGLSTVARGLKKRPPTKHIKRISNSVSNAYVHTINRDETEQYVVVITNGDLKVYALDGTEKTVNFPNGKAYLSATDASTQFGAVTVADYTFIVNKATKVTASSTLSATRPEEGLVVVKNGLYGKTYKVTVNNTTYQYATPDGTVASQSPQIATDYIASQLATAIQAGFGTHGVTCTVSGSVLYFTKSSSFSLETSDGYGNQAMYEVKGRIQRFSDLPANATITDFTVEIVGDKTTTYDNYWVRFDRSSGDTGVWRETLQPGISVGLTNSTMPWALVRESDGTFTFKYLNWNNRLVGDDKSAPQPSFVGAAIGDIFFHRNRLGFIADESVCFSEAGSFFNFYPTTVTDLLDSDPIDVQVSHTKVSKLKAAVPFSKQLLLFSDQTQFVVESGDLLTPKTISIKPTTEFEASLQARPQGVGRVVFFATPGGSYSGLREYYVDQDNGTNDAADVTSHVPRYIPSGVVKLAAAPGEDLLCVLSKEDRNTIYAYKFYWANNDKLQSSWSKWAFPEGDEVLNLDFIQSTMFVVINRADGLYLESLDVSADGPDTSEPYLVHLDRKTRVDKSVLTFSGGQTQFTTTNIGWTPSGAPEDYTVVVGTGNSQKTGTILQVTIVGSQIKVDGNYTDCDLIFGRRYTFRYQFSTIVPKIKTPQGGEKADNTARLQLRNMQINYSDTGYFQAQVTPVGRSTYTYTYTGKTLGLASSTIGAINLETGLFRFPVMSQNTSAKIELVSDSPLPCAFLSADWEGFYAKRSQGI